MNDYTNAPPPPGALFDNVPVTVDVPAAGITTATATWHLTPATRISQIRGGRWVAVDVFMQYGQPLPLALALSRVAIGRTVFVQPGDAETVLDAVRGGGNGETVP